MKTTKPLMQRVIDFFVKAIVVLVSLVATVWFFTAFNKPGAGRIVIYGALFMPVVVYLAYAASAFAIRRSFSRSRMQRLSRLPLAQQISQLDRIIDEEKRELERDHPEILERLQKLRPELAGIEARAEALMKQPKTDPQARREEVQRVIADLARLDHAAKDKPNTAFQGTLRDKAAQRP